MNKRIKVISSYIDENDKVADIGCDQALLSEILAKRSMHSIASDIKENIILNATSRLKKIKLDNYVSFIVSDGIKSIPEYIDTLVLSGMGTYTILNILGESKKIYKKIVTVSNNDHEMLREAMLNNGYKVLFEEIIFDKSKYYNLILFVPGKLEYSETDLLVGINHKNHKLLLKKLAEDLKKYRRIYEITKDDFIEEKIKILEIKINESVRIL